MPIIVDTTSLAPGVVVREITPAGPIAGVSTSVAAIIGEVAGTLAADDDDEDLPKAYEPVLITNWTEFTKAFGRVPEDNEKRPPGEKDPYDKGATLNLPFAVRGFLDNGGSFAYVVPVPADTPNYDTALTNLESLPNVSIVCAPGVVDTTVQGNIITHCQKMKYRFAVLDGNDAATTADPVAAVINNAPGVSATNAYGAVYWPWLRIAPPPTAADTSLRTIPPSGHVAGIYARSDSNQGVHKAPANEAVNGALAVTAMLNDAQHGRLNEGHVNAIRLYPNRPPMVWGARTRADEPANTAWRYVNVRRLLSFIEQSIVQGIEWAVFEPNNQGLWKSLDRTITEFLTRVWQSGALFGASAAEAFYVKIDKELNTNDQIELGNLNIEIGVAPVRPAEFVIVQIGQWDGGTRISES